MRAVITDREALAAISTLSIHAYLKSQGWTRSDDLGDRGVVYIAADGNEVFAPGSDRLGDYAESVSSLLEVVARVEQRDELAVFRDLASSDRDVLRFRAPHADDDGSIDLTVGVDLVEQCREALHAAACATVAPKRSFRSGGNLRATDYIGSVKLGQTEHGSFVVTLLSPVPPLLDLGRQASLWYDPVEEPFSRQVTTTLSEAATALRTAISEVGRGGNIEAFERVVAKGVSANLCAAIAKFVEDGKGLDFSVTWARTRPTSHERMRAEFIPSDAEVLREAARVLRDREPRNNERIEGFVTALARDQAAVEGRIRVKAIVDGKLTSVFADLDQEMYAKAVHAHKDRVVFALEGDLERVGQRWSIKRPRHLSVADPELDENDESQQKIEE